MPCTCDGALSEVRCKVHFGPRTITALISFQVNHLKKLYSCWIFKANLHWRWTSVVICITDGCKTAAWSLLIMIALVNQWQKKLNDIHKWFKFSSKLYAQKLDKILVWGIWLQKSLVQNVFFPALLRENVVGQNMLMDWLRNFVEKINRLSLHR